VPDVAGLSGGWPIPRGGSGAIVAALRDDLEAHGGTVVTGHPVRSRADLPDARAYLFDTTPRTLLSVLGDEVPPSVRRALERFRYGNAAAKVDFVLDGPVPWADPEVARAGTVHVGGTHTDMARAEAEVQAGRHADLPVCLVSDPAGVDPAREVGGLRPLWTYTHVPAGSDVDVTETVTAHIERYAPGFRDVVVASRCVPAARMAEHNSNYIAGDISAGAVTMWQIIARPSLRANPFAAGAHGAYLCSSSAPPGPGVHGMSGYHAARRALREVFGVRIPAL
jgi:phytoene dehydrogenase-like protein